MWLPGYFDEPTDNGPNAAHVLKSSLRHDDRYQERHAHNTKILQELHERLEAASKGKGGKYLEVHATR